MQGDCRAVLPRLAAGSVHCVVTSPPYYGLRDYGVAGQMGLEASLDDYLAEMVGVFREVRRVLRADGTCWVNMGDSYNANQGSGFNGNAGKPTASARMNTGLAPKQLLMVPARLALALQADGWWLRSDIIWSKPNPMPESVTDRPTSAHEHVYLLTKSARYYWDAEVVREDAEYGVSIDRENASCGPFRSIAGGGFRGGARAHSYGGTRNMRNVWELATEAFGEAHFATFPTALAERCIRAGTSERGCCGGCGAPHVRTTDVSYTDAHRGMVGNQRKTITDALVMHAGREQDKRMDKHVATLGWSASCGCGAATVPCLVLDPFGGAGTTGLVADRLRRDAVLIELSPAYCEMARRRIAADGPLFNQLELFAGDAAPVPDDAADARMADLFASRVEAAAD